MAKQPSAERPLPSSRQENAARARMLGYARRYRALASLSRSFVRRLTRPLVLHPENLRPSGSVMVLPNASTPAELAALVTELPGYFRWSVPVLFTDGEGSLPSGIRSRFPGYAAGLCFRLTGMLSLDRDKDNWATFLEMYSTLRAGFRAGVMSWDADTGGPLAMPRESVFVIARDTGATVVPVAVSRINPEDISEDGAGHRLLINVREAFAVADPKSGKERWLRSIHEGVLENGRHAGRKGEQQI